MVGWTHSYCIVQTAPLNAGAVQLNEAAMQQLQRQGYDKDLVVESLLAGDCNAATAAYHLLQQALNMRDESAHLHQAGLQVGGHGMHKHSHAHMRVLSRSHSAQPGIPAYRPSHMSNSIQHEQGDHQTAAHGQVDYAHVMHQQVANRMRASQ